MNKFIKFLPLVRPLTTKPLMKPYIKWKVMNYKDVCEFLPKAPENLSYWNFATYIPFIRKRSEAITELLKKCENKEIELEDNMTKIYHDLQEENSLLMTDLKNYDIWKKEGKLQNFIPHYRPFNFPLYDSLIEVRLRNLKKD